MTAKLPFLAVGRVQGAVPLAYYASDDPNGQLAKPAQDVFNKLLAAASQKLQAGQRTRLAWNDGSVCCLMDSEGAYLYCVVTEQLSYPEKLAYQLLYDLIVVVEQEGDLSAMQEHGLQDKLNVQMRGLVKKFEDPGQLQQFGVSSESITQTFQGSAATGHEEAAPQSRMRMIIIAVVLIAALAGGIFWFMTQQGGEEVSAESVGFTRGAIRAALASSASSESSPPPLVSITMV